MNQVLTKGINLTCGVEWAEGSILRCYSWEDLSDNLIPPNLEYVKENIKDQIIKNKATLFSVGGYYNIHLFVVYRMVKFNAVVTGVKIERSRLIAPPKI